MLVVTAVLVAACPSPGGGGPGGNPPPEVALTFEQATVRKSKLLVSTNGDAPQTYTNTLRLGTTPVTTGAAYRISANPGGHTPEEISVNERTGEVTFTKALYDKMTPSDLTQPTGPPARITIEAAYQGKTASYDFTVTDHFRPRGDHTSVVLGNDIYVIGGRIQQFVGMPPGRGPDQPEINSNEVWRSSDKGLTWDQVTDVAKRFSPARTGHSAVVLGEDIYVIAGEADYVNQNDVWKSSDRGVSWNRATQNAPFSARYFTTAGVLNGAIYLMGGFTSTTGTPQNVYKSGDGTTWSRLTPVPEFANDRYNHTAVVLGGDIYVIAGQEGSTVKRDVWKSQDNGQTWREITTSAGFGNRTKHSSAVQGGAMYLIGGSLGPLNQLRNDVWKSTDGQTWVNVHKNP